MTGEEVTIRLYVPGDELAINDGFNRVFKLQRTLAEWAWKFPPEPAGRMIMVAEGSGGLLAHYAALPLRFQVDGRVWSAAQIVDVFADHSRRSLPKPSARAGGGRPRSIFLTAAETFLDHFGARGPVDFFYGFPGQPHRDQGLSLLGYDDLPTLPLRYLARRAADRRRHPRRLLYRAERARDWEPRLDELWERVKTHYPVAVVRDAEWALRRLAGHPDVHYHRFLALPRLGRRPVAFVAFRSDGGRCRWVDLVWDHDHPGALDLVDHLSARLAAQTGAEVEELWLNGDQEGTARLAARGFVAADDPDDLAMVGRRFEREVDASSFHRVYLTMADCDLV